MLGLDLHTLENWTAAAWPLVVQLALDATIVLLAAVVASLAMRRRSAALRHGVWTVAIVGLLALPLLRTALPGISLGRLIQINQPEVETRLLAQAEPPLAEAIESGPLDPGVFEHSDLEQPLLSDAVQEISPLEELPAKDIQAESTETSEASIVEPPPVVPKEERPSFSAWLVQLIPWPVVLVGLWGVGVLWQLLIFATAWTSTAWSLRRARPVDDPRWQVLLAEMCARLGLRRTVTIVQSDRTTVPSTAGWLRPKIILPPDHATWSDDIRRVVLAHELTHVARRDVLWQMVARAAGVFYWFHPLVHLASRRLRWERELACDDAVLRLGERPSSYARHLLGFAAALAGRSPLLSAAVAMASRRPIETRIRSVLHPTLSRTPLTFRAGCVLVGVMGLVLLAVGVIRAVDTPAAKDVDTETVSEADAEPPTQPVAEVTRLQDCVWGEGSSKPLMGAKLIPGDDIHLRKGSVEIAFSDRVKVTIESPSRFQITGKDGGVLTTGRLVVNIPKGAENFSIKTPTGVISKKAARFEVKVDEKNGKTETRILDNETKAKTAQNAGRSLLLTVLDEKDQPVAGVKITRRIWKVAGGRFKFSRHRCDENGQVRLDIPEKTPHYYTLNIVKTGHAPYYAEWEQRDAPDPIPETYTVRLDPGQTVGGVVQDEQGQPIKGVRVSPWFNLKTRPERTSPLGSGASVRTNAQGQWTYTSFPTRLQKIEISLQHPDYLAMRVTEPTSKFAVAPGQKPSGVVVMKQGLSITGKVTDEQGKPIAGATVRCHDYRFGSDVPTAKTNKEGIYRIKNVNSNETFLTASADGLAPAMVEARIESGMNPVDFKLSRGKPLRVRVIDAEGHPIAGAGVSLRTWQENMVLGLLSGNQKKTGADGTWTWDHAPDGVLGFDVYKKGYAYIRDRQLTPGKQVNAVTMHRETTHVLRVSGRVIDAATKKPIARFRLTPGKKHPGQKTIYWSYESRSEGRDGQYRKDFLSSESTSPRKTALFRIEADGYLPATSRLLKLDEGDVTLDFKLRKAPTPDIVVLTPKGKPTARATVAVCTPELGPCIKNGDVSPNSTCERTTTDTNGRFHLAPRDNEDAVFALMVLHPSGTAYVTRQEFEAAMPIRLEPWARVEGIVRIGGRPAADQLVTLGRIESHKRNMPKFHYSYRATTDKNGRFAFDNVVPGPLRVTRCIVSRQGEMSSWIPADSVRLECLAGQTAHVELDRQGRPVVGRLRVSDDMKQVPVWPYASIYLSGAQGNAPRLEIPWPKNIDPEKDRPAALAWLQKWQHTEKGKAFTEAQRVLAQTFYNQRFSCGTRVERDGSFRFDDIPAGDYTLLVKLNAPPAPGQFVPGPVIATLKNALSVPKMPDGRSDKPLDLDELELTPTEHAEIEEPATNHNGPNTHTTVVERLKVLKINKQTTDRELVKRATQIANLLIEAADAAYETGTITTNDLLSRLRLARDLKIRAAKLTGDKEAQKAALEKHIEQTGTLSKRPEALWRNSVRSGDLNVDVDGMLATLHHTIAKAKLAAFVGHSVEEKAAWQQAVDQAEKLVPAVQKAYEKGWWLLGDYTSVLKCRRDAALALLRATEKQPSKDATLAILKQYAKQITSLYNRVEALHKEGARGGEDVNFYHTAMEDIMARAAVKRAQAGNIRNRLMETTILKRCVNKDREYLATVRLAYEKNNTPLSTVYPALDNVATNRARLAELVGEKNVPPLKSNRLEPMGMRLDLLKRIAALNSAGARGGEVADYAYAAAQYATARLNLIGVKKPSQKSTKKGSSIKAPPTAASVTTKTKLQAEGKKILEKIVKMNFQWLSEQHGGYGDYIHPYEYDFVAAGGKPKHVSVDYRRRGRLGDASHRQGILWNSALHYVARHRDDVLFDKIEEDKKHITIDYHLDKPVKTVAGNCLVDMEGKPDAVRVSKGRLVLDRQTLVPREHIAGGTREVMSDYVLVGNGHYLPQTIDIHRNDSHWRWSFAIYPSPWLLKSSHSIDKNGKQKEELARVENVTIRNRPEVAERTGEIILRAVDADTGRGVAGAAFGRDNMGSEAWGGIIGRSDSDGYLRVHTTVRRPNESNIDWDYSIWKVPKGYKVVGKKIASLIPKSGKQVGYTFKLRKQTTTKETKQGISSTDDLSQKTKLQSQGQKVLKKMARANVGWLINQYWGVEPFRGRYEYDFVTSGQPPRHVVADHRPDKDGKVSPLLGLGWKSALHHTARHCKDVVLEKIEQDNQRITIDYRIEKPVKIMAASYLLGMDHVWALNETWSGKGRLVLDRKTFVPLQHIAGNTREVMSDYVPIGEGKYLPRTIDVYRNNNHFRWKFAVYPGLWLFRSSHLINEKGNIIKELARVENIKIKGRNTHEYQYGQIVLRAVDIDTGQPLAGVAFGRCNSYAEAWGNEIGKSDNEGYLRFKAKARAKGPGLDWYYSVWKLPEDYKVAGLEDVLLVPTVNGLIEHTFKLRKRGVPKPPKHGPLTAEDLARGPKLDSKKGNYYSSTVKDMPGFVGKEVLFRVHTGFDAKPDAKPTKRQRELAAEIFRDGEYVAKVVRSELEYFKKVELKNYGRIDGMNRIIIDIGTLKDQDQRYWNFECHLPDEIYPRGYRFSFRGLEDGDLRVPDYWQ